MFRPSLKLLSALSSIVCAASAVISCSGTDSTGPKLSTSLAFVRMSAGDKFSCGLEADGTAWCWGLNDKGQLGDGTTTVRTTPTRVATSAKFTTIASGYAHTCALTIDGSAWCWGQYLPWGAP